MIPSMIYYDPTNLRDVGVDTLPMTFALFQYLVNLRTYTFYKSASNMLQNLVVITDITIKPYLLKTQM